MSIWPRRTTVTPAVHLGLVVDPLRVDHKITHTYEARPKPTVVTLQYRNAKDGFILGQVLATFPGQSLRLPDWIMRQLKEQESDQLEIVVSWL